MRTNHEIDYEAEKVGEKEMLIRLLCSPLYYDEQTRQVNIDAFDLRMLGKRPETYVSIGRKSELETEEKFKKFIEKGYRIWNTKKKDKYYGYGEFQHDKALSISNKIEVNPLKDEDKSHIGLFYIKNDKEYYTGPLSKNDPEILEMLYELAKMLSDRVTKIAAD